MIKEAVLSADGKYRYRLSRIWSDTPFITFVMLNPSTANDQIEDPTLRRCINFACGWGYGGLNIVNLYALRATDPSELWLSDDPIGPENAHYLTEAGRSGEPLVAAWGGHAKPGRVRDVLRISGFERLMCLRITKRGAPAHPLYLPKTLTPVSWPGQV
ncbi:DUF1643 domain-containing protein [Leucobacter sp. W1478]|uniref:DUF1643 domain-containing protein n=1 Tax=Leucobacter sp. W1478 TaxID=3439065 RepID=UPI003F3E7E4B